MDGRGLKVIVGVLNCGACREFLDHDFESPGGPSEGPASVSEITRYVSVLISSGSDWGDRIRCLAARAPELEIFAEGFVLRDDSGWCITDPGRRFLAALEAPIPARAEETELSPGPSVVVPEPLSQAPPTLRLVVHNTLGSRPTAVGTARGNRLKPFSGTRRDPLKRAA